MSICFFVFFCDCLYSKFYIYLFFLWSSSKSASLFVISIFSLIFTLCHPHLYFPQNLNYSTLYPSLYQHTYLSFSHSLHLHTHKQTLYMHFIISLSTIPSRWPNLITLSLLHSPHIQYSYSQTSSVLHLPYIQHIYTQIHSLNLNFPCLNPLTADNFFSLLPISIKFIFVPGSHKYFCNIKE